MDWTARDAETIAALALLVEAKPCRGMGKCCLVLEKSHPTLELQTHLPGVLPIYDGHTRCQGLARAVVRARAH